MITIAYQQRISVESYHDAIEIARNYHDNPDIEPPRYYATHSGLRVIYSTRGVRGHFYYA